MIKLTPLMSELISQAPRDGLHCLIATATQDSWPQIAPKGSLRVLDEQSLCYWERSLGHVYDSLRANPRVTVYYRNAARKDDLPRGAGWRFCGLASVVQSKGDRQRVIALMPKDEMDRDLDRKGSAILIKVVRITDIFGNVVQEDDHP